MDDGRISSATSGDKDVHNAYWEDFTQAKEVVNLFVWNFPSELLFAAIDYPGGWHDSKVAAASFLFDAARAKKTPANFSVLPESAFLAHLLPWKEK